MSAPGSGQGVPLRNHGNITGDDGQQNPALMFQFPPNRVCEFVMTGPQSPTVRLSTLSWFWVPVIGHAFQVPGIMALPSDIVMHNRGAVFSLTGLVDVVRSLIQAGIFSLVAGESRQLPGGGVYFEASAQDHLHRVLLSHQVNSPVCILGQYISNWFDHLYVKELMRLQHPQAGRPNAFQAMAHWQGWPPYRVMLPSGQVVLRPGGGPITVWI